MRANPEAPVKTDHYIQPVSRLKNRFTIAFIVISNSFGNLLLAIGAKQLAPFAFDSFFSYIFSLVTNGWILSGVCLLALWMYAQLAMLRWSDLSYVVPVTASGYILTAILGEFVLNEPVSLLRWIGIAIISFGVVLVSDTRPRTVHEKGGRNG